MDADVACIFHVGLSLMPRYSFLNTPPLRVFLAPTNIMQILQGKWRTPLLGWCLRVLAEKGAHGPSKKALNLKEPTNPKYARPFLVGSNFTDNVSWLTGLRVYGF